MWKDRLLEFAYTLYLDSMCEACGGPVFECRHPDNAGQYEVATDTCHKKAAVDEFIGQQNCKPEPGQRFYATEIDSELVTRRTFAVPADADDRGDESGESDD